MHTWIPFLCSAATNEAPRCLPLNSINSNLDNFLSSLSHRERCAARICMDFQFLLPVQPIFIDPLMNGNVKLSSRPIADDFLITTVVNKQSSGWLWASKEIGIEKKSLTDTTNTILLPHFYRFSFFYYFPGFLVHQQEIFAVSGLFT